MPKVSFGRDARPGFNREDVRNTSTIFASGGWELHMGSGYALGYTEAKSFAKSLLDRVQRQAWQREVCSCQEVSPKLCRKSHSAFCVRGEVPKESESSVGNRCGCTAIILCGVRMKVPEKVFARAFVEVGKKGGDVFSIDAVGALKRWAVQAIFGLDARRSGDSNAWSGWCADYRADRWWPGHAPELHLREEWDWTFQSSCTFEDRPASVGDDWREAGRLVGTIDDGKHAKVQSAVRKGHWVIDDASPMKLFIDGMTFEEQTIKLYEDFLSDLGLASLTCRCRHGPAGFELRLRWFATVNPECAPKRGFPHCRLRDAFLYYDASNRTLRKTSIEPSPLIFHSMNDVRGNMSTRLDAEAMYRLMCISVRQGRADAHCKSRARYVAAQLLAPESTLPPILPTTTLGVVAQCIKVFDSPKSIIQLARDPDCGDRIAVASSDGHIVVVQCTSIEWQQSEWSSWAIQWQAFQPNLDVY